MPNRLFHPGLLHSDEPTSLSKTQSHYLQNVLRHRCGDSIIVFNNVDGEWLATISNYGKNGCEIAVTSLIKPSVKMKDLYLAYAPVKQGCTQIIMQATELGVTNIIPVITERTIVRKVNHDKLVHNAIEATEQSERLQVPIIHPAIALEKMLAVTPFEGNILFCKERADTSISASLSITGYGHCVLIGPEGGFTARETGMIESHLKTVPIGLGNRIMRTPTAAIAALAMYQTIYGHWQ